MSGNSACEQVWECALQNAPARGALPRERGCVVGQRWGSLPAAWLGSRPACGAGVTCSLAGGDILSVSKPFTGAI